MHHREAPFPHHEARGATHGDRADAELAAILPEITGPNEPFRHRQHIHLAFLAVRRYGMPEAITRICEWIQRIAAGSGLTVMSITTDPVDAFAAQDHLTRACHSGGPRAIRAGVRAPPRG